MRIIRVLRGIVATAVTWAGLWVPTSLIPIVASALTGHPMPLRVVGAILVGQGIIGAINGIVFGSVLAVAGRRKTFDSLSMRWIAACGAVGGVLFPAVVRPIMLSTMGIQILPGSLIYLVINALLGAGCAALTLSVARRAPALRSGDDNELDAGAAVPQIAARSGP